MKKLNLLFVLMMITALSYGQVFTGVNWVNWGNEPDYPDVTGYDENPYDAKRKVYTVHKAPAAWAPVASVADFDATWNVLGDAEFVDRPGNIPGGDLYDLGDGNTFGASWKAVHDGAKLYVLLKYLDLNAQADANTRSFEVCVQPKDPIRHQPTFDAGDAAADMAKKNMAYGRYVELGGGKALFKDGAVTEYAASVGTTGAWGANTPGLEALIDEDHFWNNTDGIIRSVLVFTFDGALSYPDDPADVEGARTGITVGTTFAFDVKSNSKVTDQNTEYWWSADKNNGYASNYYSGHVTLSAQVIGEDPVVFTGVNWVNWGNEPDYTDVTGYAENPYTAKRKVYTVFKAPAAWAPVADVAAFDATWDVLGDEAYVDRPGNIPGGDLYDLGEGNTFGSAWKAVHDGAKLYILVKYWDTNAQADAGSRSFEIMAQPKDPVRHEPTFDAGVAAVDMAKMNMAYGRYVELGGGKALFKDGAVTEYAASVGLTGAWGANTPGLESLIDEDHFWNSADGVIKAVLVMPFNGALAYPADPNDIEANRVPLAVGATFAFDVKSNSKVAEQNTEYWWSADKNNGYASNYYSGHVTISATELPTNVREVILAGEQKVYVYNSMLYVRGSEPVNLEVYNVLGARVKSAQSVRQLSLNDLDNGIYLVRVNGGREAIKVVKY